MRPMFGPLSAMTPAMLFAENVCFGPFMLSPDVCAQRTEPPNVPATLRFVHVPPYLIRAAGALLVGVTVNFCPVAYALHANVPSGRSRPARTRNWTVP